MLPSKDNQLCLNQHLADFKYLNVLLTILTIDNVNPLLIIKINCNAVNNMNCLFKAACPLKRSELAEQTNGEKFE
jgi:hypothetical protein